jgi:hypothetical protein
VLLYRGYPVEQLAVDQEVSHFHERAVRRELLDRIAAIEQHAGVTVDKRDLALTTGRGAEGRIESEDPVILGHAADIEDLRPDGARTHRQL